MIKVLCKPSIWHSLIFIRITLSLVSFPLSSLDRLCHDFIGQMCMPTGFLDCPFLLLFFGKRCSSAHISLKYVLNMRL
uniref:Putative ovule protein n=1 Tax=Solanum chacoense TaxID=4108 RepID=A0A0V0HLE1_SOLCH